MKPHAGHTPLAGFGVAGGVLGFGRSDAISGILTVAAAGDSELDKKPSKIGESACCATVSGLQSATSFVPVGNRTVGRGVSPIRYPQLTQKFAPSRNGVLHWGQTLALGGSGASSLCPHWTQNESSLRFGVPQFGHFLPI